jgi:3-polyprenyl-4-hydroxybenzoate decarboxylase
MIIFGEPKRYDEVFNEPIQIPVFSNMMGSIKRSKTYVGQQPRQTSGTSNVTYFPTSSTGDQKIGRSMTYRAQSAISEEEEKVYNLQDFESVTQNNHVNMSTPII